MADQTATVVLALRPEPSRSYDRARLRDFALDRFWVIPLALLLGGAVLAGFAASAEELGAPDWVDSGPPVSPAAAQTILETLATSMLTFVGVVFTLSLVALQLASAQLSPRVIRTFTRSTLTKVAFGVFLATFSFSIGMLVLDEGSHNVGQRSRAVSVAAVLVTVSVLLFLAYVSATMRLLQVSWVITRVAEETRSAIAANHPPAEAYRRVAPPVLGEPETVVRFRPPTDAKPDGGQFGVVRGINRARLVELARAHDCVVRVLVRHGEYVSSGGALVAIHGGTVPPPDEITGCFSLGRARTMYQDPAYGLRQLVDVAIQALSPALNQPTTAVQVIDRLQDILVRIARQPIPAGLYVDQDDVVRLVEMRRSWPELVDLAIVEILVCGVGSPQVTRRLVAVFDALADQVSPEQAEVLELHRRELTRVVRENGDKPAQHLALSSNPLGMG